MERPWTKTMARGIGALLPVYSMKQVCKWVAENRGLEAIAVQEWARQIYGDARTRSEIRKKYSEWAKHRSSSEHETGVKKGIVEGLSPCKIAKRLKIGRKRITQLSPQILAQLTPEERGTMHLNRFIRRFGLKTTAEELEAMLHATIEDHKNVRASAIGVRPNNLKVLLAKLPEFELTKKQIVQRKLTRLKEAGEPIHKYDYMRLHHRRLLQKASYCFGRYFLALRSIGVKYRPKPAGKPFLLSQVVKPLTEREAAVLHLRCKGTSLKRISGIFGKTIPDTRGLLERIKKKVNKRSHLNWRLANLDKMESELEKSEAEEKPANVAVFEAMKVGKPIAQISIETGLTVAQATIHARNLSREQRLEILRLAHTRLKQRKEKT